MGAKLIVLALVLGMFTGLIVAFAPPVAAAVSTNLDPPNFDGFYYVPGETIRFTITIGAGDPTTYDIVFAWDNGLNRIEYSGNEFDDVVIPPTATSITRTYLVPSTVPDGDFYWLEVHDGSWIENGGAGQTFGNVPRLFVRTWEMTLEMDRPAYLPGDTVTILWSVNHIRDGSLAPSGFGKLWVWDSAGVSLIAPNPMQFPDPTGTQRVTLLGTIPQDRSVVAFAYYNSTATNPDRVALGGANAAIDGLRMLVNVPRTTYEPGGVVTVDVSAKVSDLPGAPFQPGAPGVEVDVTVTDQLSGAVVPTYGAQNLLTDAHGNLRHVFQLNDTVADGTFFQVRASGVANNAVTDSAADSFSVISANAISVILRFSKNQYLSDDSVEATVEVVTDLAGPFTFLYEARDGGTGSLLFRQTTDQRTFQYRIPATFAGDLRFLATADDGQGNRATSTRNFVVATGILVVSLDRAEYGAGETVTASFALTSNVISAPAFYYEVFDNSGFSAVLVKYGIASITTPKTGSVSFLVPANPADVYEFRITASEAGRAIVGTAEASYVSGVLLQVGMDKTAYLPGETIRIRYSLVPRGRTALPQNFEFLVTVIGAPTALVQTTSSSGELTYRLPSQLSEGETVLFITEQSTGASVTQVVKIGATNPLWDTTIGGIPAFAVLLGVGMLFIILLLVLLWRRSAAGMPSAKRAEKPAPPPMTAVAGPAPMMVNCKACGSPIDITTSKRPIEVMCPNCGETQIVA